MSNVVLGGGCGLSPVGHPRWVIPGGSSQVGLGGADAPFSFLVHSPNVMKMGVSPPPRIRVLDRF